MKHRANHDRRRRVRDGEPYRVGDRPCWYGDAYDLEKEEWRRRSTGLVISQHAAARAITQEWLLEGKSAEAGVALPGARPKRARTLAELVDEYIAMKGRDPRGFTAKHLAYVRGCLGKVIEKAGWKRFEHVDDEEFLESLDAVVADWMAEQKGRLDARMKAIAARVERKHAAACARALKTGESAPAKPAAPTVPGRAGGRGRGEDFTPGTRNHYRNAFTGFTKWVAKRAGQRGEQVRDPLAFIPKWSTDGKESFSRRAFLTTEVARLVSATRRSAPLLGIPGPDRAMLYLVAIATGFRANELRSLTPRSFRLDTDPPLVELGAAWSKNDKPYAQPLVPTGLGRDFGFLPGMLRSWLSGMRPDARCWDVPHNAAQMVRRDIEAAGVVLDIAPDCVADFHALRGTLGRWLCDAGVMPQVAQQVLRHSDMKLTLKHYTAMNIRDLAHRDGAEQPRFVARESLMTLADGADRPADGARSGGIDQPTWPATPGDVCAISAQVGEPWRTHTNEDGQTMRDSDEGLGDGGAAAEPSPSALQNNGDDGRTLANISEPTPRGGIEPPTCRLEGGQAADSKSAGGGEMRGDASDECAQLVRIDPAGEAERARMLRDADSLRLAGAMAELSLEDAMRAVDEEPFPNGAADDGVVSKPAPAKDGVH